MFGQSAYHMFGWIMRVYIYIHCLVVWNMFYFSIYWESHHPNLRTHIFQRGRLNH